MESAQLHELYTGINPTPVIGHRRLRSISQPPSTTEEAGGNNAKYHKFETIKRMPVQKRGISLDNLKRHSSSNLYTKQDTDLLQKHLGEVTDKLNNIDPAYKIKLELNINYTYTPNTIIKTKSVEYELQKLIMIVHDSMYKDPELSTIIMNIVEFISNNYSTFTFKNIYIINNGICALHIIQTKYYNIDSVTLNIIKISKKCGTCVCS